MTTGSADCLLEHLGLPPQAVRDELVLSLDRVPRARNEPMPVDEGLWVGCLRRMGAARLRHWGYVGLVDSVQLLISELVTNALRYGTADAVVFRFVLAEKAVLIEVDDGSPAQPQVRAAGPAEESGRGMLLVSVLADDWGTSFDGTRTWCSLAIPAGERTI